MKDHPKTVKAQRGEKTIPITIRLWTDTLAPNGEVMPKHAFGSGVVRLAPNKTHGIKGTAPVPFTTWTELLSTLERVLADNGVTLHTPIFPKAAKAFKEHFGSDVVAGK